MNEPTLSPEAEAMLAQSGGSLSLSVSLSDLWTPIQPNGEPDFRNLDHGDPFTLTVPPEIETPYRYVTYTTGQSSPGAEGGVFRSYGSNDLREWDALGAVLQTRESTDHWAPAGAFLPEKSRKYPDKPFVLMYSGALGSGKNNSHKGHKIVTAYATSPLGPFVPSGTVLTEGDLFQSPEGTPVETYNKFAIDPDLRLRPDGKFDLMFCLNDVADYRERSKEKTLIGTCIVSCVWNPLTDEIEGIPTLVTRPHSDWHIYDPARDTQKQGIVVPGLPEGETVVWGCNEGPVILSDTMALYSGGCYQAGKYYAVGVLLKKEGVWHDMSAEKENCLLAPDRVAGLDSIGHCSAFTDLHGCSYLMTHVRIDRGDRQMVLVPFVKSGEKLWCPTPKELLYLQEKGRINFVA